MHEVCVFFGCFAIYLLNICLELWIVLLIGFVSVYVTRQVYDLRHICVGDRKTTCLVHDSGNCFGGGGVRGVGRKKLACQVYDLSGDKNRRLF